MCGRYTLHHDTTEVAERFAVEEVLFTLPPRYNIAPSQEIAVVTQNGTRRLDGFRWGLVPFWAKDPAIGSRMINARAETLAEKPTFKQALARRRCLIPGDGFYEWQKVGRAKQPMYARRGDGGLFAFAGLWETWKAPDGEPLRTCTIITVAPNALMASIHDRMPAILPPEDEARWLDPEARVEETLSLLRPYPAEAMTAFPVSPAVNTPGSDEAECILPLTAAP